MIRAWKWFWITLWCIFVGSIFTKNVIKYKDQPIMWNVMKTCLDTIVLVLSAIFLPPFLIASNVSWLVKNIQRKWLKVILGIIYGIIFGVVVSYAMELLILIGIFSIDDKTGPDGGIIGRWNEVSDREHELTKAA